VFSKRLKDVLDDPHETPIRVNLPPNESSFASGNGEGCWAIVSRTVKQHDDDGKWGGAMVGLLQNFPFYNEWRHLHLDSPVLFQFRGPNKRAIAYLDQLKALKEAEEYENAFVTSNMIYCAVHAR
jgi:hypothetical protein